MKQIHLLTGNPDKIKAANHIFAAHDIEILPLDLNIPEPQAASSTDIARAMAIEAFNITGKPVIREDHSFYIKELGFPGPFMAYVDKAIGNDQLLKILSTLESRDAYFELGAAYCDQAGVVHEFSYQVPVVLGNQARGNEHLRWERLMMFPGETQTFAESNPDDRIEVWTKNYEAIARVIKETSVQLTMSA